jgi:hypothetical protein
MDVAFIFRRLSGGVDRMKLSEKASRNGNLAFMAARSWSDMYSDLPSAGSRVVCDLWWEASSRINSEAICWASCNSVGERDMGRPE